MTGFFPGIMSVDYVRGLCPGGFCPFPQFSTPVIWSINIRSCIVRSFIFSVPNCSQNGFQISATTNNTITKDNLYDVDAINETYPPALLHRALILDRLLAFSRVT